MESTQPEHHFGHLFKTKRESMKISLEEVSRILKVKKDDIAALEEENLHLITKHFYLPGFIKSYGKMLQIKNETIEEYLKNLSFQCNTKDQKHQLINLDHSENKKPSRDDLVNAILIFAMIYLLLISFSQFKIQNLAVTDLIVHQLDQSE
jgi:cytoskeletal protein RodZ